MDILFNGTHIFRSAKGTIINRFLFGHMVKLATTSATGIPIAVEIHLATFKNDREALYKSIGNFLTCVLINTGKSGS
jgi:hypothetical protein